MTCHARREYLAQNCNIFSVLSIFKYNPGKANNNLLLLNNFYSVMYRCIHKEDKLLYTVWSLVVQLLVQEVKEIKI